MARSFRALSCVALALGVGILLSVLACSVRFDAEFEPNSYPMLAAFFALSAPFPNRLCGRSAYVAGAGEYGTFWSDMGHFFTAFLNVLGACVLFVLHHVHMISLGAAWFALVGSAIVYVSVAAYMALFRTRNALQHRL